MNESAPFTSGDRPASIAAVALHQAYRLINHGPTVLVTSQHAGLRNVMAAAWNMPLDFDPPQVAVVIDKNTWTRRLVEASHRFVLNVPGAGLAQTVFDVGQYSGRPDPHAATLDKFAKHGIRSFPGEHPDSLLVEGCLGWLECEVLPESQANQTRHDLFLAQVHAAWADTRVFREGRWHYERSTPAELRTLHYVAGGHFLTIGDPLSTHATHTR